ncbi:MAG: HEAT repeat domain-containing protein [Nitrospirae bacterium]|nr:HEAT repeat domain-containing protein [Nitrospirota bacterium]
MPKESLETLISELVHEEDWRRMRATAACLKGGPKAVDGLIRALESGSPALKMEAAGMLARIKDPRGGVPLVRLLKDEDPAVRKAGAIALEQMAGVLDAAAASALVEDLHELRDEEQRKLVIGLLGLIPNAIAPLTAMLKHPEEAARLTAAMILEHLRDPRSADALVDAMGDPALQEIVVRTLKKLGAIRERIDQTFDRLRNIEEFSEREAGRMAAVIELLGIGRPSVEILIEYLRDDDWLVREAAADLLGKIGDIRAVEPLIERLKVDNDTGVKELAVKSLGLIGDSRPVDLLVELIPIRPLRIYAVESLAKVKDIEALRPYAYLFERLKTDRDGLVSYNSGMIVDKLQAAAARAGAGQEGKDEDE